MGRGFVDRERSTEYVSAKIFGDDRIKKIKSYCKANNVNTRAFLENLVDDFFEKQKNALLLMSKEDLIDIILNKGVKDGN